MKTDPRIDAYIEKQADFARPILTHLRAMLLGHNLTLQISGGEVVLGQWQRILMVELDGPRTRAIRLQVMAV